MDSASARPINPASVKPAAGGLAGPAGLRLKTLLLDPQRSATDKLRGIESELSTLDPMSVQQVAQTLIAQMPGNTLALGLFAQGLKALVEKRALAPPVGVPGQSAPSARSVAPSVPFVPPQGPKGVSRQGSGGDQLAALFRPAPGTQRVQQQLDDRLHEALGAETVQQLPSYSKQLSSLLQRNPDLRYNWEQGPAQFLQALQKMEDPEAKKLGDLFGQFEPSVQSTILKALEHQRVQIGKAPEVRAQLAEGLLPWMTASRDVQIAKGIEGCRQHAPVLSAAERVWGGGGRAPVGKQTLATLASLRPESSEWGALEQAMGEPLPVTARQAVSASARVLDRNWQPVTAIAPVMMGWGTAASAA